MAGAIARARPVTSNGLLKARPLTLGIAKLLCTSLWSAVSAAPVSIFGSHHDDKVPEAEGTARWVLFVASAVLVLLGGAFAGLTIALMGQDGIYLQVLSRDTSEPQQKNAKSVFDLLQKGKHWVLVTLLLSNVIVNETLPVVLDRTLGGGVAAVVGSTVLIVIFGEIIPQSLCVRYGLPIGGFMAKPVLVMMWLTAIVSWPIAKLLDWLLGEDHGTVYKKSGLKTLVTLHKSLGDVSQRLNQDEVTIISAVLDLKAKPVESVMTPMSDVFTMSEDTVLDEPTMDLILSAGYSRIPIHEPGSPTNFVGMLLVKILITYDPEDAKLVSEFPLATLPETRPETSCLDIVNFFQEGKSHMVLVSEYPGEDHGALGVVTLEDVIEELIGEEIIDESDVYIDVHKAIRRLTPAPKARLQRVNSGTQAVAKPTSAEHAVESADASEPDPRARRPGSVSALSEAQVQVLSSSPRPDNPRAATLMMRRSSAGIDGQMSHTTVPVRTNFEEMKQHLRHLGPSNPATNPKGTKSTTVKIKPGHTHPISSRVGSIGEVYVAPPRDDDETTSLLNKVNGKDGVQALQVEHYGSISHSPTRQRSQPSNGKASMEHGAEDLKDEGTQTAIVQPDVAVEVSPISEPSHASSSESLTAQTPKRTYVRSGSITESVVETRGVRKVILATTGTNEEEEAILISRSPTAETSPNSRTAPRSALNFFGTVAKDRVEEENEEENEEEEGLLKAENDVSGDEGSDAKGAGESVDGGASSSTSTTRPKTTKAPARKKPNRRRKRKGGRS